MYPCSLGSISQATEQIADLQETIRRTECDLVLIGTPIDLRRLIDIDKPALRVRYDLRERGTPDLPAVLARFR